jgi:DEAD/DEAH box helicase domain-containing protein
MLKDVSEVLRDDPTLQEIVRRCTGLGKPRSITNIAGREAEFRDLPAGLPTSLRKALTALGRDHLYAHQRETLDLVRQGQNVLLVTSTASGKTLAFNTSILDTLLREGGGHALYIYPLNALANDQRVQLEKLVRELPVADRPAIGITTGQATPKEKQQARNARLVLTNPETIHHRILQHPGEWSPLLSGLRFIVLDEAHMYRGAFGAHMAHVVRRLLRLAARAGSQPQLIGATATIGNPAELGQSLTSREFTVVDRDGSTKPDRKLVVWQPSGGLGEYQADAVKLTVASLATRRSVILFAGSRYGVENVTDMVRKAVDPDMAASVTPYRGGFTASQRKKIEDGLRSGQIRAVITTNALEAGIDIGSLDVAIIAGYPGTMMAFWQQAGRAGRGKASHVFYVPSVNPLDEYFAEDPDRLLTTPHELATFDPWNPRVATQHVMWRALEAWRISATEGCASTGLGRSKSDA